MSKQTKQEVQGCETPLSDANLAFAVDLFHTLRTPGANVLYSPLSISTALAMVYQGTKAETRQELVKTLHYDSVGDVAESFRNLLSLISSPTSDQSLTSANRLCVQDKYPVLQEFIDVLVNHFSSSVQVCDFEKNAEESRVKINEWVSQTTNKKIEDLLPPDSLNALTRLVIINAVYFKKNWLSKFDVAMTTVEKFHISPKQTVTVDMMQQKKKLPYGEDDDLGCRVVELPYEEDVSMYIILPKQDHGLDGVEARLSASNLRSLMNCMVKEEVVVYLPRFKIKNQFDLVSTLKSMGTTNLFDNGLCDLSGIDGTRMLYVSNVFHESFVEVNEEGTEAAAATAVVMKMRCMPRPPILFRADQPFLFLIHHNSSKTVLFLGRMATPINQC